jgi:hypothetical protein
VLRKLFAFLLTAAALGAAVFFHQPILELSDTHLRLQESAVLVREGKLHEAHGILLEGVRLYPKNRDLLLQLAKVSQQVFPERTNQWYEKLLQQAPQHTEGRMAYGRWLLGQPNGHNAAAHQFWLGLKETKDKTAFLISLGDVYQMAATHPDETREKTRQWLYRWALYYYQYAAKQQPQSNDIDLRLGEVALALHQSEKAASAFCNVVERKPHLPNPRFNLGMALLQLGFIEAGTAQVHLANDLLMAEGHTELARQQALMAQSVRSGAIPTRAPLPTEWADRCLSAKSGKKPE